MTNTNATRFTLLFTRIALGWLMLYAGLSKMIDPSWSAQPYLMTAKTFPGFYAFLASPQLLPAINFINGWGLLLLGISLITGLFLRISGILGALLMALYYLPVLQFPWVAHGLLVDEHIVYAGFMLYLAAKSESPLASWQKIRRISSL